MAATVIAKVTESARRYASEHGPQIGGRIVRDLIAQKKYDPYRDLNLKELAVGLLGESYAPRLGEYGRVVGWVKESTEAVDLSIFRSVIRANVGPVMEQAYQDEATVTDQLLGLDEDADGDDPMAPRLNPVPAVAIDPPRNVAPATDYPRTGFQPFFVHAPKPDKVGLIAALTLELVKANRARRFLDAAAEVARKVGIEERTRKLRVVLGIVNNYRRNNTAYNTYLTSGDRINRITTLNLNAGPAELDRVLGLFDAMVNPFTQEPMSVRPTAILTVRENIFRLRTILGVVEISVDNAAGAVAAPNPLEWGGPVYHDRYVKNLLVTERGLSNAQASTWMAIGDFPRAFKWRQVEPFHTFEVGPDDESWPPHTFQDIVYACKARFWGVAYVADPFAVAEAYTA